MERGGEEGKITYCQKVGHIGKGRVKLKLILSYHVRIANRFNL
jgi:hypothetical protein